MSDITAASKEQSSGIEQVNQAILQMDETTQQNAALVEQATAAADAMRAQAIKLFEEVSAFKIARGERVQGLSLNEPDPEQTALPRRRSAIRSRKLIASDEREDGDWNEY